MNWHRLALNPEALETLYDDVPELENVELFSIKLDREGSNIAIRFDLPRFPDHPSKRWQKDFNTAQLKLNFWSITDFEGRGWHLGMTVKINIEKQGELIKATLSNPEIDLLFSFLCGMFRIDNISAYQKILID